jgi:hypothetical protein
MSGVTAPSHAIFASKVRRQAAAIIGVELYVVRTGIFHSEGDRK